MRYEELIYKSITVNHDEKYVNVYICRRPLFVNEDGLDVIAKNLLPIGLKRDPKEQVFDGDIVELFDWGRNTPKEPFAIVKIAWNSQYLCWDQYTDSNDDRLFGDSAEDEYDKWRTNPNVINNVHIPRGYEIRNHYKL